MLDLLDAHAAYVYRVTHNDTVKLTDSLADRILVYAPSGTAYASRLESESVYKVPELGPGQRNVVQPVLAQIHPVYGRKYLLFYRRQRCNIFVKFLNVSLNLGHGIDYRRRLVRQNYLDVRIYNRAFAPFITYGLNIQVEVCGVYETLVGQPQTASGRQAVR